MLYRSRRSISLVLKVLQTIIWIVCQCYIGAGEAFQRFRNAPNECYLSVYLDRVPMLFWSRRSISAVPKVHQTSVIWIVCQCYFGAGEALKNILEKNKNEKIFFCIIDGKIKYIFVAKHVKKIQRKIKVGKKSARAITDLQKKNTLPCRDRFGSWSGSEIKFHVLKNNKNN